jgi:hypothetical protein
MRWMHAKILLIESDYRDNAKDSGNRIDEKDIKYISL